MGIGTPPEVRKPTVPGRAPRGVPAPASQGGFALAPGLFRAMLRGRWLLITILVVIAAGVMVGLGDWQFGRLQGRRAANAVVARQMNAPPLALDTPAIASLDPAVNVFRRVSVRGTWDYDHEIELRFRSYDGQAGVHLLTPLRVAGSDRAVLVDRGWIPFQQAGPEGRRAFRQGDSAEISGLLYLSDPQSNQSGDPSTVSRVDLAAIGAQVPYPLASFWVKRLPGAENSAPPLADDPPALDDGPHLGYMIQWWAFAATLLITYVIFVNQALLRERSKGTEREGGSLAA